MQGSIISTSITTKNNRRGFTIVELLIVIVVIGILAAITIVAYNGIQGRAQAATVQSDLENAAKQLAIDQVTTSAYPATVALANNGAGLKASAGTTYQYAVNNTVSPQTFCVTATNVTISYFISSTNNTPTAGACPGQGSGGVAAVTNLVTNPSAEVNTVGWDVFGGASIARSIAWSSSGSASFQATNSSTTNSGDFRISGGGGTSFPAGMQAGHTYTMSAQVRITNPVTGGYDRGPGVLYWYSIDGSTFVASFGPKAPSGVGIYMVTYTFTIPVSATGCFLGLGVASSTAGQSVYYDSIMLTAGSAVYNYADGNSPNWIWNGTLNASTSTGPPL